PIVVREPLIVSNLVRNSRKATHHGELYMLRKSRRLEGFERYLMRIPSNERAHDRRGNGCEQDSVAIVARGVEQAFDVRLPNHGPAIRCCRTQACPRFANRIR